MDTARLYIQKRFSDLTLKLSDGATIKVHKIILCSQNEYFNRLCGPDSRFAERDQAIIELKEDDPEAIEALIRYLYNLPAPVDRPWRFWLSAIITADKYLTNKFSEVAWHPLYAAAF